MEAITTDLLINNHLKDRPLTINESSKKMRGNKRLVHLCSYFWIYLLLKAKRLTQKLEAQMITPIEKGIALAKTKTPPDHIYKDLDLSVVPKYVAYKSALIKERATYKTISLILLASFCLHFAVSRYEVLGLQERLRTKEYIAVPGVENFTVVNPQGVPDGYVESAVQDFLLKLGNTNPINIDEQYKSLQRFMAPDLMARFEMESSLWSERLKREGIIETLQVDQKEIRTDDSGKYLITALARRNMYSSGELLSSFDEVIEMVLELRPPKEGRRWFLEITSLNREKKEDFNARRQLSNQRELGS